MIAFVIPTHRRPAALEKCLQALVKAKNSKCDFSIIVVMDGSCNKTLELKDRFTGPDFHYLMGDGNLFWGGAVSVAMDYAFATLKVDRVVWLNDDTGFSAEQVSSFCSSMRDEIDIFGARLYASNVDKNIYSVTPNSGYVLVPYLNGNFTSISRKAYGVLGALNYNRFPHFADAPYLELARRKGFSLYVNTDVTVDIVYDVLRHLSLWQQVVLRKNKLEFIRWQLFDIRSKWYIPYRWNYCINKSNSLGSIRFILSFCRDWFPVAICWPLCWLHDGYMKRVTLKIIRKQVSKSEFRFLLKEIEVKS